MTMSNKFISTSLLMCCALLLSACGFHIRTATTIPETFKTINYVSENPYGSFSRSLKRVMKFNNIIYYDQTLKERIPTLKVTKLEFNKTVASIYQDGRAAENQLTLDIEATVMIPNYGLYPLTVKIFNSFFDNPAKALAKSSEEYLIRQEMQDEAATQLINQLITVQPHTPAS